MEKIKDALKRVLPESVVWFLCRAFPSKPFMYDIARNERIVEYGWVLQNIPKDMHSVLDVGCSGSMFPQQLASLGYLVTGIDMRRPDVIHPEFKFIKMDVLDLEKDSSQYDVVTCISALEHMDNDDSALEIMKSMVKPGGCLLLTVPCGVPRQFAGHRIYDPRKWGDAEYFYSISPGKWCAATNDKVDGIVHDAKDRVRAILCKKFQL